MFASDIFASDAIQQLSLYLFYPSLLICASFGIYQGWQLRNKALWGAIIFYILGQVAVHSTHLEINMIGGMMFALTLGLVLGYFPHGLFNVWTGQLFRRNW
ncbi:hypothetical protein [Spirulina sp. 06S082]|uniref:hypothetical protein n=1 Tax=Spirulina sp. 06S082 TaxID=3110248 RepID=UPI002B217521|nr:hypothetical protein [Spirulina sp. 06S082]MEA5469481.1 hypothetical protein [Spirulina sp. 06S082]